MKNLFAFVVVILLCMQAANAQSPQSIPFQGVARDSGGVLIPNQAMAVRITIHDGSSTGSTVYQETQTVTTNNLGLFTLSIGSGTRNTSYGTFSSINWGSGAKFAQLEVDPSGGTGYINMGTSQLQSVPYALYALNSGSGGPWTISDTSVITSDTTKYVGIGTAYPTHALHVNGSMYMSYAWPDNHGAYMTYDDSKLVLFNSSNMSNFSAGIQDFMVMGDGSSFGFGSTNIIGLVQIDNNNNAISGMALSDAAALIASDMSGNYDGMAGANWYNSFLDVSYNGNTSLNSFTIDSAGAHWEYNDTSRYTLPLTDGAAGQVMTTDGNGTISWKGSNQVHSIFTPSSGATISAVWGTNIINPSSGLGILGITLPSSPVDNETVYFTFTRTITALTFSGGTVAAPMGTVSSVSNGSVKYWLTYDAASSTWY